MRITMIVILSTLCNVSPHYNENYFIITLHYDYISKVLLLFHIIINN